MKIQAETISAWQPAPNRHLVEYQLYTATASNCHCNCPDHHVTTAVTGPVLPALIPLPLPRATYLRNHRQPSQKDIRHPRTHHSIRRNDIRSPQRLPKKGKCDNAKLQTTDTWSPPSQTTHKRAFMERRTTSRSHIRESRTWQGRKESYGESMCET